ncbi:MAG TPA: PTS transporter subunit IIC, partial [Anaerovoracaceae bacterium]|nr:PTS transporter subunit IIC [Anaerovoracaceae bacterium]
NGLTEKFGFWGEPLTIGLLVGLLIAILGSLNVLGEAKSWSGIFSVVLTVAGVMVIYPNVSGLFVKGLIPLSQAMNTKIRSNKMKRDQFHIAMDPAIYFGESANLTAALILIPIVFFISLIMPGNQILMLADIPAMPFMTAGLIIVFRGNILTTVIAGTFWFSFANILNSDVSSAFTQAAIKAGVADKLPTVADAVSQGLGVASWTVGTNPVLWLVYKAFSAPGNLKIVTIIIAVAVFLALYFSFRKHKMAWYMAAGASEEFLAEKYSYKKAAEESAE